MGKRLKQQRRGKGSIAYAKPPHTFDISVDYAAFKKPVVGEVIALINHTGHTAPLMRLMLDDLSVHHMVAPEGIKVGDKVHIGHERVYALGSVLKLKDIPEGTLIYNVESSPGDGGKFVRAAGAAASVVSHIGNRTTVMMPSKANIDLSEECRAQLGATAGGGMSEAPIMKAGKNHHIRHAINRTWPVNRGVKMNPADHPFGGKQHHKGQSSMTSRNAPPGRKVGHIAARRVGRRKSG